MSFLQNCSLEGETEAHISPAECSNSWKTAAEDHKAASLMCPVLCLGLLEEPELRADEQHCAMSGLAAVPWMSAPSAQLARLLTNCNHSK